MTIYKPNYDAVLVDRIPQVSGPPVFSVVDRFPPLGSIAWTKELNQEGSGSISTRPERLPSSIQSRLLAPDENPMELWIYRDAEKVFAGPVIGYQYQGQFKTLTLHARGILYYLRYMFLQSNYDYMYGEDPFLIVKAVIDAWQSLSYGNFGINTGGIGTSEIRREVEYHKVDLIEVAQVVKDLGAPDNGFDFGVDPETRIMTLYNPQRGTDKSDSVVVDARNLRSYSLFFDVTAGDFASEVFASGTGIDLEQPLWAVATNPTRRAQFGRTALGAAFQGVESQETLQRYAQALVDTHSNFAASFGGSGGSEEGEGTAILPTEGMTPADIEPGDTISVTADLGFGEFNLARDVVGVFVHAPLSGNEEMSLAIV